MGAIKPHRPCNDKGKPWRQFTAIDSWFPGFLRFMGLSQNKYPTDNATDARA
jgi:hypothetical protein